MVYLFSGSSSVMMS